MGVAPIAISGMGGAPVLVSATARPYWSRPPRGRAAARRVRGWIGRLVEAETARALVPVGDQAGQSGDRNLWRGLGADVQTDRPVHPGNLAGIDAEQGERLDVRRL